MQTNRHFTKQQTFSHVRLGRWLVALMLIALPGCGSETDQQNATISHAGTTGGDANILGATGGSSGAEATTIGGAIAGTGGSVFGTGGMVAGSGGELVSGGTTGGTFDAGGTADGGISDAGSATDAGGATSGDDAIAIGADGSEPDVGRVEDHRAECNVPAMPQRSQLPRIEKLPDPFSFKIMDGEVTTKEQWKCRREEINAAAQAYIYGEKPIPDTVTGSFSGGTLTITVEDEGNSISFGIGIRGGDPNSPKPLLISYGGLGGLPGMPSQVVTANYNLSDIAVDSTSRSGKFYTLYGRNHPAGELIAWAWGVSRIIDALETTPEAGIDPARVAVHGCSRYGKGALAAGAFDARIALTIPEEAGSGGGAAWRIIAAEKALGQDIQTLGSACTERVWLHADFCSWAGSEAQLPVDMHEVMGMVAPRGLLFLDGNGGNQWLAVTATYWSAHATAEIYKALGVEGAFTYSQMDSSHCMTPQGQSQYVSAYANYYLLGQGQPPTGGIHKVSTRDFNASQWIDWDTPDM